MVGVQNDGSYIDKHYEHAPSILFYFHTHSKPENLFIYPSKNLSYLTLLAYNALISTAGDLWGSFIINPFMSNGISYPYQLDQSIFVLRVVRRFFFSIFIQILIGHS